MLLILFPPSPRPTPMYPPSYMEPGMGWVHWCFNSKHIFVVCPGSEVIPKTFTLGIISLFMLEKTWALNLPAINFYFESPLGSWHLFACGCRNVTGAVSECCFLFQETHTVREPDRLQDIWAEQKATELDRGESHDRIRSNSRFRFPLGVTHASFCELLAVNMLLGPAPSQMLFLCFKPC